MRVARAIPVIAAAAVVAGGCAAPGGLFHPFRAVIIFRHAKLL